jgi:hypothetical protein
MWDPQPLTTLRASKVCRGENFTFTYSYLDRTWANKTFWAEWEEIFPDLNILSFFVNIIILFQVLKCYLKYFCRKYVEAMCGGWLKRKTFQVAA